MTKNIRTVKQWKSAKRDAQLQKVAVLIGKGCTVSQIASSLKIKYDTAKTIMQELIQRWTERIGVEGEKLAIRVQQLLGIFQKAMEDYESSCWEEQIERVRCEDCLGRGDVKGIIKACPNCQGEGEIQIKRQVRKTAGNPQFLNTAMKCITEISKLEGLYIERKSLREEQAEQHLHQHVHIEGNPFKEAASEDIIKVQDMLERLLKGESSGNGKPLEGRVE